MSSQARMYPPVTVCGVRTTDPLAAAVLVDSGALVAGNYDVRVMASADAAAVLQIEHRNAANSGSAAETPAIFDIGASNPVELVWRVAANKNERVRVAMQANLTGHISASIQAFRVA